MNVDYHHFVLEEKLLELVKAETIGREFYVCYPLLARRTGTAALPIAKIYF